MLLSKISEMKKENQRYYKFISTVQQSLGQFCKEYAREPSREKFELKILWKHLKMVFKDYCESKYIQTMRGDNHAYSNSSQVAPKY